MAKILSQLEGIIIEKEDRNELSVPACGQIQSPEIIQSGCQITTATEDVQHSS